MADPRRRLAPDVDPAWPQPPGILAGAGNYAQPDPIEVTGVHREIAQIPAPPGMLEFNPETQAAPGLPPILAGSGYRPQPDPVEITGIGRRLAMAPIELSGSSRVAQIANRGMPEGGDAEKYPEPPEGPQAVQGIPAMLARPTAGAAARAKGKAPAAATASPKPPEAVFAAAASDAQESPDFLAYVRQRAQDKAQLAAAQNKADDARKWQDVANGFVRAGDVATGRKTDEGALQQRLENTQQPVRNVLLQQEVGRASTGEALAQAGLSGKLWEQRMATQAADPNSPVSKRTQAFLASTKLFPPGSEKFVSAADYDNALKAGTAGIHNLTLKAKIAHDNAELEIQRGAHEETARHDKADEDIALFRQQREVPTQQQGEIEALTGGIRALKELKAARDSAGLGDKLLSVVGMGDYNATKNAVAPDVAKANAKGRVNPAGVPRTVKSLPGAFGSSGDKQLDTQGANMYADADAKLRELEHSRRIDPVHAAELRRQLDEVGGGAQQAPAAGARPRRTVGGETREWDGKSWVPVNG